MASSNKKTKQNLSESDLENEAADFQRFIVIESLEEVCLAKLSSFLSEKVIATKANPKKHKKNKEWNLVCQGGQLEAGRKYIKNENFSYNKMQNIPTQKP